MGFRGEPLRGGPGGGTRRARRGVPPRRVGFAHVSRGPPPKSEGSVSPGCNHQAGTRGHGPPGISPACVTASLVSAAGRPSDDPCWAPAWLCAVSEVPARLAVGAVFLLTGPPGEHAVTPTQVGGTGPRPGRACPPLGIPAANSATTALVAAAAGAALRYLPPGRSPPPLLQKQKLRSGLPGLRSASGTGDA